eukprot:12984004-Alexandrium_andersonii.AAC.1
MPRRREARPPKNAARPVGREPPARHSKLRGASGVAGDTAPRERAGRAGDCEVQRAWLPQERGGARGTATSRGG